MERRVRDQILRRARDATAAPDIAQPPVSIERVAARCGVSEVRVDRRIPPRTPQWNGLVAMTVARGLVPPPHRETDGDELVELAAAELLLPARLFAPIAARTDLTMDGVRDLARRFSAPIRLTVRQWLLAGAWSGFALLWRDGPTGMRLAWRAASRRISFPPTAGVGAMAESLWRDRRRLEATLRSGRPHHGVEEIWTGTRRAWWFTRFGPVRDEGTAAVLALVVLDRQDPRSGRPAASRQRGRDRASGCRSTRGSG